MTASFNKVAVHNVWMVAKDKAGTVLRLFRDREVYIQDGEDYLRLVLTRRLQLRLLSVAGIASVAALGGVCLIALRDHHVTERVAADLQGRLASMQSAYDKSQALIQTLSVVHSDQPVAGKADAAKLAQQIAELQLKLHDAIEQNALLRDSYDKKLREANARLAALQPVAPAEAAAQKTAAAEPPAAEAKNPAPEIKKPVVAGNTPMDAIVAHPGKSSFRIGALLRQLGMMVPDEGGPFVAMGKDRPVKLSPGIAKLLRQLPLSAPLGTIKISSGFGSRVDPINGQESFHPGLDLMGAYRTPVYNTGPGVVVHAGWEGAYGKMVEIDHGHGIHTRYGHLSRVMVNVGQHLPAHKVIGQLGSTGRSTGPHVHYEIDVNGEPVDPMKFLTVGKSVTFVKASEPAGRD